MCGLVGVVGNLFERDKRAFETLLKLDTIRGPHSTGVLRVHDGGEAHLVKEVGTPWDLIACHGKAFYNGDNTKTINGSIKLLIGHNRWATVGAVIAENAHPFHAGNIVGAHNGTLWDVSRKRLYRNELVGTDSQAIMENLNNHGVDDTFDKLEGAWAITWYDIKEDTLNIVRNKERPLYYAFNKRGDVMYYASEPWMIFTACERHDIDLEHGDRVHSFAEDTHYRMKVGPSGGFSRKRIETSDRRGYKYVPPVRQEVVGNNVVPFPPASPTSSKPLTPKEKAGDLAAHWGAKKGQYVEFKLGTGWLKDEQGKPYIQCFSVLRETEVRIYLSRDDNQVIAMLGADDAETFTAKIKKVKFIPRNGGRVYMTTDIRTLEMAKMANHLPEVDDVIPWMDLENTEELKPDDSVVVGPDGNEISHSQFIHLTSKGCCWCSYQPQTTESKTLTWIHNSEEFLCEDCASNENVKQYIAN